MLTRDLDHLELILELIEKLERRLTDISLATFEKDQDEIDLAAFRLGHIGEQSNKLSDALKARHSQIDWKSIYRMRNIISHNYSVIAAPLLWNVVRDDLPQLKTICLAELGDLGA
jgi:uncharacterized protein with HEPN domain